MKVYPCRWFLLCENDAAGVVPHPVLGDVPTCQRCADKLGLALIRYDESDDESGSDS